MLWKSVMVIKSTTVYPSVKEKTLPKIILIQSEDSKALAEKVLQLLPFVNITNPNHSIKNYFKGEFKGIKVPPGEFKGIKEPLGEFKGIKEPPGKFKGIKGSQGGVKGVKGPTGDDTYELIHHVADKNSVALFRQAPIYYDENCLVENKPCCKSKTKCKTKGELKTFVKLKMRGGKLLLETSNDIKIINVGQYCKCQS